METLGLHFTCNALNDNLSRCFMNLFVQLFQEKRPRSWALRIKKFTPCRNPSCSPPSHCNYSFSFVTFFSTTIDIFFQIVELNDKDGQVKPTCLGPNLLDNQQLQYTVPPNVWFGSGPFQQRTSAFPQMGRCLKHLQGMLRITSFSWAALVHLPFSFRTLNWQNAQ
ncbi:hypothetical protein CFP56_005018 [Quercus suber]|uniref:Uncharacterized protein n=1 Tax=Quercus suber TaxID=58331 RepID=A0AAW0LAE3_QUESU